MIEVKLPVGRLISGHPMEIHAVTDNKTKLPKMQKDGVTPQMECYVGVAIAKGPETHWNQTSWGLLIHQAAAVGFPNGEHGAATFAWKIVDGDSTTPNKKGNKPCDMEGAPGHWIVYAKQGWPTPCYHVGKYEPHQVIQRKEEIKRGDYVRLVANVVANNVNGPTESPGVYINPVLMELSRAGVQIVGSAPDASAAFADSAPVLPANALIDTAAPAPVATPAAAPAPVATPAAAPVAPGTAVAPAPDILNPAPPAVAQYNVNGTLYTAEQLTGFGWTAEQIAAAPIHTA